MTNPRLERMRTVFSVNPRRRMQDLKMSQSDLARAIWKETRPDSRGYQQPVNKDRVSVWANGRVLPSPDNLHRCAEALGLTTQDLLPEIEPNHKLKDIQDDVMERLTAIEFRLDLIFDRLEHL